MPESLPGDPREGGTDAPPSGEVVDAVISKPLRGWRRILSDWMHKRVGLYTLSYDGESYALDYDTIDRSKLPRNAVHVTGEGDRCYFLDLVDTGEPPAPMGPTATDLYCWYKNNDLDASIVSAHKAVPISKRALILLAVGAAAVVLLMLFYL